MSLLIIVNITQKSNHCSKFLMGIFQGDSHVSMSDSSKVFMEKN